MDIMTMSDPEEIRLQRILDEAAERIEDRRRGRRDGPIVESVGPLQEPKRLIIAGDFQPPKTPEEMHADHAEALKNIRAYRAQRGD